MEPLNTFGQPISSAGGSPVPSGNPPVSTSLPAGGNPPANVPPSQGASPAPTQLTPPNPVGVSDTSFLGLMNGLNTSFQQTNDLVTQKNAVLHASMGNPVDPNILSKLPSDIQSVIQGGNRDAMRLQAQILNDAINGNSASVASSIGYLTTGYENAIKTANDQKQAEFDNLIKIASTFVDPATGQVDIKRAGAAMQSLYPGVDMSGVIAQLQGQMPISEYNKQFYQGTITPSSDGSGSLSFSMNPGTIGTATNNFTGIKYSAETAALGASDSGIQATDGGTFASFPNPQASIDATVAMLKWPSYQDLTLDQAIRRWSGAGGSASAQSYGASVVPGIPGTVKVSSLTDQQLLQVATGIANNGEKIGKVTKDTSSTDQTVQAYVDGIKAGTITSIASIPGANMKSLVAKAMAAQGTPSPLGDRRYIQASNSLIANYIAQPEYVLTQNALPYLLKIDAAMTVPGSVSDQELLDSFTKMSTAGGVITDAQVAVITGGRSLADTESVYQKKLAEGGVLSDAQRNQIYQLSHITFQNLKAGYQPIYDKATKILTDAQIPQQFWTLPDLNSLSALSEAAVAANGGASSGIGAPTGTSGGGSYQDYLNSIK